MNRARESVLDLPKPAEVRRRSDFERLIDEVNAEEEVKKEGTKQTAVPTPRRERRPFAYD